jgi:hypothetical protein
MGVRKEIIFVRLPAPDNSGDVHNKYYRNRDWECAPEETDDKTIKSSRNIGAQALIEFEQRHACHYDIRRCFVQHNHKRRQNWTKSLDKILEPVDQRNQISRGDSGRGSLNFTIPVSICWRQFQQQFYRCDRHASSLPMIPRSGALSSSKCASWRLRWPQRKVRGRVLRHLPSRRPWCRFDHLAGRLQLRFKFDH